MNQILEPGRYTNQNGESYLVRKNGSMFLYDYLLMKGVKINHIYRKDARSMKNYYGVTKKEMISYCSHSGEACKNSLETRVACYDFSDVPEAQHIEGLKLFMLCQFHAMQMNLQVVAQNGWNLTSLELFQDDAKNLAKKKALPLLQVQAQ